MANHLNFVDVFSGAGGLSCGLELAGHKCLLGIDSNRDAIKTFAKNHPKANWYLGDIRKLKTKSLKESVGENQIDLVVGGPPCQGFSTVGPGNPKDTRNHLFLEFCRVVRTFRPKFIIMENVTGLLAKKNEKTLKCIIAEFLKLGYNFNVQVVAMEQYGVPERRRRTIFLGSKIHNEVLFPGPTHAETKAKNISPYVTVGDALSDLKSKNGDLFNHDLETAQIKNKLDQQRLKRIPEGCAIRYQRDEEKYLTPRLRMGVDWDKLRENRFRQAKYHRLHRDKPAPTIMTHRYTYYHPVEARYLTPREAAKLQGFPNDFVFTGPISSQWRQIGNAVPPLLAKVFGEHLKKLLKEDKGQRKKKMKIKTAEETVKLIRTQAFVYRQKKK